MKNPISIICTLLVCLTFSSCGSDYLSVHSDASEGSDIIFSTTDNVKLAVNGLSKMMTQQYLKTQHYNGEGTIKTFYGNLQGNDYQKYLSSFSAIAKMQHMTNPEVLYDYYPWYYYYRIIGNANTIIMHVGEAQGAANEKMFLKAQALTYRAYCYAMLVQLYGKRWMDSNNGETNGVVLRTDESKGDMPLSTLGQCYAQIYADLDEAIQLFTQSGLDRDADCNYLPNVNAAYAVYARAAINREDWQTAAHYASLARQGYPLMTNDEYFAGFNTPNSEWIWSVYGSEEESLYFFQFFAYEGSNSSSSWFRLRPSAISKELYDLIPATDVRRDLFLDPKDDEYNPNTMLAESVLTARAKRDYAARLYPTTQINAYMQFKNMAKAQPGVGHLNLFRSSEMYLIEAEAYCHIGGKDADVQQLLVELNRTSGRNPEYDCTLTGTALLDEVRLYNRIELWGEGHDFFNYKRWGLPIVRHTTGQGGSFLSAFAGTIAPDAYNGWTWTVPKMEYDYNSDIIGNE